MFEVTVYPQDMVLLECVAVEVPSILQKVFHEGLRLYGAFLVVEVAEMEVDLVETVHLLLIFPLSYSHGYPCHHPLHLHQTLRLTYHPS